MHTELLSYTSWWHLCFMHMHAVQSEVFCVVQVAEFHLWRSLTSTAPNNRHLYTCIYTRVADEHISRGTVHLHSMF